VDLALGVAGYTLEGCHISDEGRLNWCSYSPALACFHKSELFSIREHSVLSVSDGFLVVGSIMSQEDAYHHSQLYHFSYSGELLGLLHGLGPGPHNLTPIHLASPEEADTDISTMSPQQQAMVREPGWYVYFTDGHGGICCFKADQHLYQ